MELNNNTLESSHKLLDLLFGKDLEREYDYTYANTIDGKTKEIDGNTIKSTSEPRIFMRYFPSINTASWSVTLYTKFMAYLPVTKKQFNKILISWYRDNEYPEK